MDNKVVTTILGAVALSGSALAGEVVAPTPAPACESYTCDALKNLGKVYKNKSNPWIQEVKLFGRGQFQYGYVDGSEGDSEGFAEWRRVRLGAEVKFAKFFSAKVRANLEDGGANDHSFGFHSYDEAYLGFDLGKAFNPGFVDKAKLTYGRHKIAIGEDVHTSSKKIKTVERSALTGKVRPDNNVGGRLSLEKGDWEGAFGVFSSDEGNADQLFDDYSGETLVYLSSTHSLDSGELIFDLIVNTDAEQAEDYTNNWAASVAYRTDIWDWDWAFNVVLGDNESDNEDREGFFGGLVIQPSKFIYEDKLELVGRYYFQASSEEEGIRVNSRYSRGALGNDGRGDFHNSVYAGLNYYFCGDRAKIMTGVEYETLSTPDDDNSATTLWSAVRFYF